MEFQEFIVYSFLVLLGLLLVLGIVNVVFNIRIIKRFSGKFVRILANYELQSEDLSSLFTITYFNNNMADIKVHSFGVMYCNEQVDYYEEYVKTFHPELKKRLVIEPTDSVKLSISYDKMKKLLLAIRDNRKGLPRIYGYIIDSNGNQTTKRLKDVRKNVKRIFKAELKAEDDARKELIKETKKQRKDAKLKTKEEKRKQKEIAKIERKKIRKEKQRLRREKLQKNWNGFKTRVRGFFKKIGSLFNRKKESN